MFCDSLRKVGLESARSWRWRPPLRWRFGMNSLFENSPC